MFRLHGLKNVMNLNKISSARINFCRKAFSEDFAQVKNIAEFKEGILHLQEGKFDQAETHFKECLKIFKSINQTETMSYLFVLKKYIQALFYSKKIKECESALHASLEISKNIFKEKPELTFPFYRNILAFYTYTDIAKCSELIDSYLSNEDSVVNKHRKFFYFAGGAIKLLNNEFNVARTYMNYTISLPDLPIEYQAYNMHNMALLNNEMIRDCEMLSVEEQKKWRKDFNLADSKIAERESCILYKQALAKLELEKGEIPRDEKELTAIKSFLYSQIEIPEKEEDEQLLANAFKNPTSGLTMTNVAEMFFEKGKEKDRQTAFWLKSGIKHYENYEKENIARHLIVFALFYSQLGQTMYAEGLYRKAIELLKNVLFFNIEYLRQYEL